MHRRLSGRLARFLPLGDPARKEAPGSAAARTAVQCATLLRGGLPPRRVLDSLVADNESVELRTVSARVKDGLAIGHALAALPAPEWRVLASAWWLAEESGAPLASALERMAGALHGVAEVSGRRDVLLAGPRTTATLLGWLPLAAVGVGVLLGLNPLPVFFSVHGGMLLSGGLLLQGIGMWWARRLIGRAEAQDRAAGLECELMWIALAGGAPPRDALRRVADAVSRCRAEWIGLDCLRQGRPLLRAIQTAEIAGVPLSGLLIDTAAELRNAERDRLEQEAERLGVRILVPLACCVLPAFIAIGVVPVIVTLLGGLFPL